MQAAEILDVKQFMQLLLQSNVFDFYETVSAFIRTDMDYQMEGIINRDFFDDEETDTHKLNEYTYLPWSLAKEKVFSLIKGKKTPSVMKIVFKMNPANFQSFLHSSNMSHIFNDIDGVYININFQNQKLNVTCQISYKIFTLDKNLEQEFFSNFVTLLKSYDVTCN